MTSKIKSCYIYSDDDTRPAILLPDETPVIVGRTPTTLITDSQCSRNQVRLYASYANQTVLVQQIGTRSSGLNGFKTQKDVKLVAKHGDCLEVLYGCYRYRIEFNPPPSLLSASKKTSVEDRNLSDLDSDRGEYDSDNDRNHRTPKIQCNKKDTIECDKDSGKYGVKRMKDEDRESCLKSEEKNIETALKRPKMNEDRNSDFEMDECEEKNLTSNGIDKINGDEQGRNSMEKQKQSKESWEEAETLMIYTSAGLESRRKIAAYDMDNTLIKTQSGLVFPKDHNDWQLLYPEVPGKLKKLHSEGYKIVIFTNQGAMFLGKVKPSDFKQKIERVVKKLGVPVQAFIAAGKDLYRKPRTGMWEKLVKDKNEGVSIDKAQSFFVGDAAGRAKDWAPKKKKDHSSADRLMALNLGLTFYTPEEHFLGHKPAPYVLPEFNPKKLPKFLSLHEPSTTTLTSPKQEVVLMVGGPGSGKSHVAKTHLKSYHYINRDKLGSWQKCVAALENALSQGKSVVVDNTNPDPVSRERYINVAKAQGVPVRCFVMTTDKEHARHNNKFRELTDPSHMTVTDVIINSYSYTNSTLVWRCTRFVKLLLLLCLRLLAGTLFNHVQPYRKNYVPPKREEGFVEIVRINCIPRFTNAEHQKLYEMYLLEK